VDTDKDDPVDVDCPDTDLSLTLDTVLELLANQRRRFALYTLIDAPDRVITLETLIEDVATLEAACADKALTRDRYLEVASDLYHWHLPVLADVGIIDCDARSEHIRYWCHSPLETWTSRVRHAELPR
jgi:hypothetical protein